TETMDVSPTATPNANWSISGSVTGDVDPKDPTNGVWRLQQGGSITRAAGVLDGSEVNVRLQFTGTDTTQPYSSTWMLQNANGNGEYWGLQFYYTPTNVSGVYEYDARAIWAKMVSPGQLVAGQRDLSSHSPYLPRLVAPLSLGQW